MAQLVRAARTLGKITAAGAELADAAVKLGETAVAAGTVIGHRVALGAQALHNPASADHDEFARMGTEKVDAFAAAGQAVLGELHDINRELVKHAAAAAAASLRAAWDVATAGSPAVAYEAQRRWLVESWARSSSHALKLTSMTAGVSALALAPVHSAATGNARRLTRRALRGWLGL
jgi:hypothetical protein